MISNLLHLKIVLLSALPFMAWAATQGLAPVDPLDQVTLWQWLRVIAFALLGWAIQDLDKIAEL